MKKKGYKKGGMPMTKGPDGKMVPEFAMDGDGAGDMVKGKKSMKPEMKPKKKEKRSDAMDAVMGTGPAAPRERMSSGGMAKKGYAKGGKVRGAGIARKGTRPCKMR